MTDQKFNSIPRMTWRINDFCAAFGVGRTKVYELINIGDLEAIKLGGRTLITDASARALLERERLANGYTGTDNG